MENGHWVIVLDANDAIDFPKSPAMVSSLRRNLWQIDGQGFDSVAATVVFANAKTSSKPFRILSNGHWDHASRNIDTLKPVVKTSLIRAWAKSASRRIRITSAQTMAESWTIGQVESLSYPWKPSPYHLICLRFLPSQPMHGRLPEDLFKQYMLELTLGFMASDRKAIATNVYPY
jgi:hypothetical protein